MLLFTPYYLNRYIQYVMPRVRAELEGWLQTLTHCPAQELAHQARQSIALKEFHCLGGAAYTLGLSSDEEPLLRAIVSLQTISDYLDNLCDRMGFGDEQAFRNLHQAMLDAVGRPVITAITTNSILTKTMVATYGSGGNMSFIPEELPGFPRSSPTSVY